MEKENKRITILVALQNATNIFNANVKRSKEKITKNVKYPEMHALLAWCQQVNFFNSIFHDWFH
jgi:hypothetical protein